MIDWKTINELEWIGTEESIKQSEKLMQEYYDELAKKQLETHDIEKDIREEPNLVESDITNK